MEKIKEGAPTEEKAEIATSLGLDKIKDFVDVIGKIAIGLFVTFYALGLIVVNIHLNKFGVYSLSLFRLNYVTAGIWTLVPILVVFLIFLIFASIPFLVSTKARNFIGARLKMTNTARLEPTLLNIFPGLMVLAIISLLTYKLYFQNAPGNHISLDIQISLVSASSIVLMILFSLLYVYKPSHPFSRFTRAFLFIVIMLYMFVTHVVSFADGLYGKIPSYLGGGSPKKAQLILDEESKIKEKLADLGVVFHQTTLTANVQILLATDEEYILLIESIDAEGQTKLKGLTLPRDTIKAILYEDASGGGI